MLMFGLFFILYFVRFLVTQLISGAKSVRAQLYNFGGKLFCLEFFIMDDRQFCILILGFNSSARVSASTVNSFRRRIRLLMMPICSNTRFWSLFFFLLNCTLLLNGQRQPRRMWAIDQPQY